MLPADLKKKQTELESLQRIINESEYSFKKNRA